jgi:hypothetical protein
VRLRSFFIGSALFISACGSGNKPAQSAPPPDTTPWLAGLIDEKTDAEFRIRPLAAEKDPVFGPIMQRAEDQVAPILAMTPIARSAFETFEKSSLVIIATRHTDPTDAVIIFEGVPQALSPASMTDPSGAPLFKRIETTSTTIDEYDRNKGDDGTSHGPMALHLAKLNQMWVVGVGPGADRLDAAVKSDKMEELHDDDGPILAVTAVGDVIETAKKDHPPEIQPAIDGLSRADIDVEGGQTTHVKIALTYADENSASTAKDFVQTLLVAAKTKKPELKAAIDGMTLERDKAKVTFDAPLPADFLQAVMQHPQSQAVSADAPTDRPTPVPAKKKKKSKH